ncbi:MULTISPECIES: fluoride efflux transporter CrcB [Acinetobacter calcoaceticus/baumannii complex]|uniref:fluoride efflux transporter CrcB n=1 Tax=Acinetobacter TaxID=469 RepID=UPI00028C4B25|nr:MULTISPECIES: fluoride efflux transporter CrcB [Acinetobacter calcoaceticus/baumannii complex]HAW6997376.1 fluoride efflux transporter CrcB [Acinetobacter baumannii]EKK07996.1 protein CrcB [Acinetobacter baumannii OIFC0162]MBP1488334.1 fluoride efflux transporter CrcB [Acinetobacter nosocomialis]MEC6035611.1 fluoride efflux transporter CrcB [Acinetobacter nosocomialis]HAW7001248.1 fluoride efflux transporter CrcB [Acinetobacter baumannii]
MYTSLFSIALGAVLGAWLRWALALKFNHIFQNIPLGTMLVNLIGAFIIGFSVAFFANSTLSPSYKLFVITGFCGTLTTFSTFSMEVVSLLQSGKFDYAILTIAIHVLGSLLLTGAGIYTYQLSTAQ